MKKEYPSNFVEEYDTKRSAGKKYADKGGHGQRHELTGLSRKAQRVKGPLPEELLWEIRKYKATSKQV